MTRLTRRPLDYGHRYIGQSEQNSSHSELLTNTSLSPTILLVQLLRLPGSHAASSNDWHCDGQHPDHYGGVDLDHDRGHEGGGNSRECSCSGIIVCCQGACNQSEETLDLLMEEPSCRRNSLVSTLLLVDQRQLQQNGECNGLRLGPWS